MTRALSTTGVLALAAAASLAVLSCAGRAWAEPEKTTREQIIDVAKSGVGYGYKWGFAHWNGDGSGKNLHACSTSVCSNCCCVKKADNGVACRSGKPETLSGCKNYYPAGDPGADCSGFVAKCWGVPNKVPLEDNSHPYSTAAFFNNETHWKTIDKGDLKTGDALVKRKVETNPKTGKTIVHGHIVLFDSWYDREHEIVNAYEAAGCKIGIRHGRVDVGTDFKAIRRDDVIDFECKDDTCNGHGDCDPESGCHCKSGFAGSKCDRCDQGFVGYPSCTRADSMCKVSGSIRCEMKPISLAPQGGEARMDNYACGASGLSGGELAFRFDPARAGKATVRIGGGDADTRLLLLRGACDPDGCVDASNESLQFEFADDEVFYLVVDTGPNASNDVTLSVDCERPEESFIGDPCNEPSDCDFDHGKDHGFCYDTGTGAFCSLACTKYCPDLPGLKAPTFCIADPKNPGAGICVPKPDPVNQDCAALSGTQAQTAMRFKDSQSTQVCMPGAEAAACSGGFEGRVIDAESMDPVAHAMISVEGGASMTLETDDKGMYKTDDMPCGSYTLHVDADGYAPFSADVEVSEGKQTQVAKLSAVAMLDCTGTGSVHGLVFEALDAERAPIAGASVNVRAGVGQGIGPISVQVVADDQGYYVADGLPTGTYTVTAQSPGYESSRASVNVCGGGDMPASDLGLVKTTDLPMRVVLRWSRPPDLDLHVQTPQGDEVYFYTPCRGALDRAPFAQLDIDRRMAEGPEVISMSRFLPGRYTVFVHNYSVDNKMDDVQLSDSDAEVTVYGPGSKLLGTYAVPSSGSGVGWDVFSFDGSDPTKLKVIQRLTDRPNPEDEYAEDCMP